MTYEIRERHHELYVEEPPHVVPDIILLNLVHLLLRDAAASKYERHQAALKDATGGALARQVHVGFAEPGAAVQVEHLDLSNALHAALVAAEHVQGIHFAYEARAVITSILNHIRDLLKLLILIKQNDPPIVIALLVAPARNIGSLAGWEVRHRREVEVLEWRLELGVALHVQLHPLLVLRIKLVRVVGAPPKPKYFLLLLRHRHLLLRQLSLRRLRPHDLLEPFV